MVGIWGVYAIFVVPNIPQRIAYAKIYHVIKLTILSIYYRLKFVILQLFYI